MKRILAAAIMVLVICLGFNAYSQVAQIKISFDDNGNEWFTTCPADLGVSTLTVWTSNFDMWMSAIEYKIVFDPVVTFMEDIMIADALQIGSSPTGISIAYPTPGRAWDLFPVQRVLVMWNSTDCSLHSDSPITIVPHPSSGKIQAIRWPDLHIVEADGGTSYICPTLTPTEETTWGSVKSLYKR